MGTITLPNFRVSGTDRARVRLKDGGVYVEWSTMTDIKAWLYSVEQKAISGRFDVRVDPQDGTRLLCVYSAQKPQYLGVNKIILQCKYEGAEKAYDKPLWNFVRWTDDQAGEEVTIDDPEVDVEIVAEDMSSSVLDEATAAALAAADRAEAAAEEAEHMVEIHRGPAGKSPYKGENGNWFEWDEEAGQYVDTGVRAKGETGDTPNISIGTVTTVEPGTPAGATMGGTPEAPVLNLSIPKGLVGATPNFTIGTVTTGEPGTPVVVTLTGTAEAPVLNITIPQGMQGNTGSSVAYPFELVNNLTTDDATKALSAAQGVVLDGKISQLQQEVTADISQLGQELGYSVEKTKNVFLTNAFPKYTGISIVDGVVIGKASAFHSAFGGYKFYPLYTSQFEANTQYTISLFAKTDGESGTTGQGLQVRFVYDDNTVAVGFAVGNYRNTFVKGLATSAAGKTLVGIGFSYNTTPGNTWYLKDIQLEKGTTATAYTEPYTAIDYYMRKNGIIGEEKFGIGTVSGYKFIGNTNGVLTPAHTLKSYFPIESFQKNIRGNVLYGIRCNFKTSGTLTIVKATGVKTEDCVMTTIKAFSTDKTGWQILLFDSPIVLSESESIGICINTDTATLISDSTVSANSMILDYLHYSQNAWLTYQGNLLVDFLGYVEFEKVEKEKYGIGIVNGYKKIGNLSGTFKPAYSLNSYFPQEDFQIRIRETAIYGFRCCVKTTGTFSIVKATGVKTNDCQQTIIKTFTFDKIGWDVHLFDSPIVLASNEYLGFGINTDTAELICDTTPGADSIYVDYLHYSQNIWVTFQQNLLVDVIGIPQNTTKRVSSLEKANAFAGNNPFRFRGPLWAHLFIDKIYEHSTNIVIPSESLLDIRISRRLGFDVIEANVHTTSDGKFVVIHGASGTFGYEVTDLNGDFTYANTAINSVTLDWIKENIRYRSDIARFRTSIPTLEEFLSECRLQGIIPLVQASTSAMVAILDKYMGVGNYIAYNGSRALTFAPITTYASLTTKEAILERARSYGVPYIYSLANYNDFTDEELSEIVEALHSEGYMIASAYVSGANAIRLRRLGFDMIASTFQVNDFDNANLCTLSSGVDWSDFTINGATPTTDGIPLSSGQSVSPAIAPGTVFLGKAQLQVTFTGKLSAICGQDSAEMTSDGTHPLVLSSYFINSAPTFVIYGVAEGATITDIVFKASKC